MTACDSKLSQQKLLGVFITVIIFIDVKNQTIGQRLKGIKLQHLSERGRVKQNTLVLDSLIPLQQQSYSQYY